MRAKGGEACLDAWEREQPGDRGPDRGATGRTRQDDQEPAAKDVRQPHLLRGSFLETVHFLEPWERRGGAPMQGRGPTAQLLPPALAQKEAAGFEIRSARPGLLSLCFSQASTQLSSGGGCDAWGPPRGAGGASSGPGLTPQQAGNSSTLGLPDLGFKSGLPRGCASPPHWATCFCLSFQITDDTRRLPASGRG